MTDPSVPPTSNELAGKRTDLADERTSLALTRTLLAIDRTLMAWVRTATSLISFSFTAYKFMQTFAEEHPHPEHHFVTVRGGALILMALGVGGLIAATWQSAQERRQLETEFAAYGKLRRSSVPLVASIVAGLGIMGFVVIFLNE